MNILRANFKHLYQKRSFWFLGLVYGVFAFGVIMIIAKAIIKNKQGSFSAPVLWMFFITQTDRFYAARSFSKRRITGFS